MLPAIIILCLSSIYSTAQQYFSDPDALVEAVNTSMNGGVFIVSNGIYNDFEASIEIKASASNPVVIKAETIGGVTLTGTSHFVFKKSAFVTLEGFVFDAVGEESLVKLEGSNNIRITQNVFELETTESIKWVFDPFTAA
jgi:poly(beta-D-mannuronate) lyase